MLQTFEGRYCKECLAEMVVELTGDAPIDDRERARMDIEMSGHALACGGEIGKSGPQTL